MRKLNPAVHVKYSAPCWVTSVPEKAKAAVMSAEQTKCIKNLKQKISQLENKIEKSEREQKQVEANLAAASSAGQVAAIGSLSLRLKQLQRSIEKDFDELSLLSSELASKEAE